MLELNIHSQSINLKFQVNVICFNSLDQLNCHYHLMFTASHSLIVQTFFYSLPLSLLSSHCYISENSHSF